jgi:hypothetical protein
MSKPKYDAVQIPITWATKKRNLTIWGLCLVVSSIVAFAAARFSNENDYGLGVIAIMAVIAFAYAVIASALEKTEWKLSPLGEKQKRVEVDRWKSGLTQIFLLILGGAAIFYFWTPVFDLLSGRITVYPESCIQDAKGACPWKPEKQQTFIVHVDQQLVIATAEELPAPVKLHNCVVADVSHWTCALGPEKYSSTMTMKGGEYSADGHYVSRFKWLADHLN